MALFKDGPAFAFLVLDSQTNHIYLQECVDDEHMHEVRRVLNCYRPVEVVLPDRGHKEIAQMARQICSPHIIEISLPDFNIGRVVNMYCDVNMSLLFRDLKAKYEEEDKNKKNG